MHFVRGIGLLLVLILSATTSARAQTPRVDEVRLIEAGLYESGPANSLQFVRSTDTVPGIVGAKFGMRYAVLGPPSALPLRLLIVTRLPQRGGQLVPQTGQRRFRIEEQVVVQVGSENVTGYSFDFDWEIVAGPWVFEIWIDGRKLLEKGFTVERR